MAEIPVDIELVAVRIVIDGESINAPGDILAQRHLCNQHVDTHLSQHDIELEMTFLSSAMSSFVPATMMEFVRSSALIVTRSLNWVAPSPGGVVDGVLHRLLPRIVRSILGRIAVRVAKRALGAAEHGRGSAYCGGSSVRCSTTTRTGCAPR